MKSKTPDQDRERVFNYSWLCPSFAMIGGFTSRTPYASAAIAYYKGIW